MSFYHWPIKCVRFRQVYPLYSVRFTVPALERFFKVKTYRKRPGSKVCVRLSQLSALEHVRFNQVLLYTKLAINEIYAKFGNPGEFSTCIIRCFNIAWLFVVHICGSYMWYFLTYAMPFISPYFLLLCVNLLLKRKVRKYSRLNFSALILAPLISSFDSFVY